MKLGTNIHNLSVNYWKKRFLSVQRWLWKSCELLSSWSAINGFEPKLTQVLLVLGRWTDSVFKVIGSKCESHIVTAIEILWTWQLLNHGKDLNKQLHCHVSVILIKDQDHRNVSMWRHTGQWSPSKTILYLYKSYLNLGFYHCFLWFM